jgi:hypothetical protein
MLAQRVLYYGQDRPLPRVVPLRAGPLSLLLEDGDLRYIKYGDREIIRRIYVAIRDRNWGTVPNTISNFSAEIHDDSFRITFDVTNRQGEIDFSWRGSLTGNADGLVEAIGFCILYPSELAGAAARVTHSGGAAEEAALPEDVSPNQPVLPFGDMNGLAHRVQPGLWADVRFAGDIFEMEDQRNWTDASFKIFCTPLSLPYPALIKAGEPVVQSVTLRLVPDADLAARPAGVTSSAARLSLAVDRSSEGRPLPKIGLGAASHDQPLTGVEVERLKKLDIGHLRADLQLSDANYTSRLQRAAADAETLGVPLHFALKISVEDGEAQLAALADLMKQRRPNVAAWLIYPARELFWGGSPVREVLELAHRALDGVIPGARFGSGTDADYIFMSRSLPPLEMVDFLTFAITPQVHAFDNASVVETARAQAAVAHSAQRLSAGRPVIVSPITFKMRYNAYASEPPKPTPPGVLPSAVDPRQMSLFGAGWTICSIGTLATTGVESVTYFETTGWRGVMETASGSPLPDKFQSFPGGVYPMYHIFADVAEFAGGEVLAVRASNPLAVDGLALGKGERLRVLVANMTDTSQDVAVGGMPEQVNVRMLDETHAERAMQDPETFRSQPGRAASAFGGTLALVLPPYAVARLDA